MANDAMREEWDANAVGWVEHEAIFDSVFEPVTATLSETLEDISPGERLLDVGCGSGTMLAAATAMGAAAVGVDISPEMAEAARRRAPQATVLVADAQTADLLAEAPGAPFEQVISRFGVMFFSDPAAAFANIRGATAPGASLTFACWRGPEENPMFSFGFEPFERRLGPPADPPDPTAPGPMAFADPDRLRSLLSGAGWESISIDPFDFTCDFTRLGGDGVEERISTVLGSSGGRRARSRLVPEVGPEGWAAVVDEVRALLRDNLVDGGVRFPGACWLVRGRNTDANSGID